MPRSQLGGGQEREGPREGGREGSAGASGPGLKGCQRGRCTQHAQERGEGPRGQGHRARCGRSPHGRGICLGPACLILHLGLIALLSHNFRRVSFLPSLPSWYLVIVYSWSFDRPAVVVTPVGVPREACGFHGGSSQCSPSFLVAKGQAQRRPQD